MSETAAHTPPAIKGAHHAAFRCRDAEETRAFYEDILGMKLAAALAFDEDPAGRPRPYMHLFFEMSDGNYIAFFDLPHTVKPDMFEAKDGMEIGHYAMEVADREELLAFKKRLDGAGVPNFGVIDHHFVHSIYFWDPNGVALEITYRDPSHDTVMAEEGASAHDTIKAWSEKTKSVREERLKPKAK